MASRIERKAQKVEHNYKDRSHLVENDHGGETKPANASDRHFPVKLHYMLSELEQDGLDHIVSWQPHGRCFVVHKQEEFVRTILPTWFRQSKFASFQRQLNLYGFKRLTTGRDKNGYYHELFLRGKRFLAHRIPRSKLKGQGARKPTSPETEPNFYLYGYLPAETKGNPVAAAAASGAAERMPNNNLIQQGAGGGVPLDQMLRGFGMRPPMLALPHLPLGAASALPQHQPPKSVYDSLLGHSFSQNTAPLLLQPASQDWHGLLGGRASAGLLGGRASAGSLAANLGISNNPGLLAAVGLLGPPPTDLSSILSPDLALRVALSQATMRGEQQHRSSNKPPSSNHPHWQQK